MTDFAAGAPAAGSPSVHQADDFIIYSGPCGGAVIGQLARGAVRRLTGRDRPPRG